MAHANFDLFEQRGARFSECGAYRYSLWRIWNERPPILFLMLNPSTADEVDNDPTVERCERRARAMGAGGLKVANIFALRSTDPQALYSHPEPIGALNDAAIVAQAREASMTICAWGGHGRFMGRDQAVMELLRDAGVHPHCLALNRDGTPRHPLYVSYDVAPAIWHP